MPVPAIDAGLFVAYLVPGFIVFYGLSFISPRLAEMWRADGGKATVGGAAMVTLVALVAGIFISISRAALIDTTFAIAVPSLRSETPYWESLDSVEIDYLQLTKPGYREAFLLAIANEQRPYQFAGNTALAVPLAVTCWIISLSRQERRKARVSLAIVGTILAVGILYVGARASHYRFVHAVQALTHPATASQQSP